MKALWKLVEDDKKAGEEWFDNQKEHIMQQARTRADLWALHMQDPTNAVQDVTKRQDEYSGSVGSSIWKSRQRVWMRCKSTPCDGTQLA